MTVRSRTPPVRTPARPIRGVAPAPRATAVATPGMGTAQAPAAPPLPQVQTTQVGPLPAAASGMRGMKNAELRGKIARLERDNAALVAKLADLRTAIVEIADELDDKMLSRRHDQPLLDTAFRLRRVITT